MTSLCTFYPMMVLYMLVSRIPIQLSFRKYIRSTHLVLFPDTDMQGADAWLVSHDIQGAVYIQKWTRLLLMSLRRKEPTLTLSQWSSSGNPGCLELRPQCTLECHWRKNCWLPVCFQCASSGLPVTFQWSSNVFQLCKSTLDRHWNITGC